MKRFVGMFVLTAAEQRLVIVLVLLLVLGTWSKQHRETEETVRTPLTPSASPTPDAP